MQSQASEAETEELAAMPLQYSDSSVRFKGIGTEYVPAFLRALGKGGDAMYRALGCFAQIQIHAAAIPVELSPPWQTGSFASAPYEKLNLYGLATHFKNAPPLLEEPISLEYSIEDGVLMQRVASPTFGFISPLVKRLYHPDASRPIIPEEEI